MKLHGNRKAMALAAAQRNHGYSFHCNDGEGEGGGGGLTQADIDAAVAEATAGLKNKNTELLGNLKAATTNLKQWEGLEPDKIKGMLSHFENDQDLKDISEGKHEEVINRRVEKDRANYQSQIERLTETSTTQAEQLEAAQSKIRDLVIDSSVVSAFVTERGLESAIPDVVLRAKSVFTIEDGEAIARDGNGEIIRGKEGALTIAEYINNLKTDAPHLFPGSQGGGAGGGSPLAGGAGDDGLAAALAAKDHKAFREIRKKQMARK